ncbi:unnamed protein product, partial [Prorocentrum cordatum]
ARRSSSSADPPCRVLQQRADGGEPGMTPERWQAGRQADPGLSDEGLGQAEALADFLAGGASECPLFAGVVPLGRLLVSPVKRPCRRCDPPRSDSAWYRMCGPIASRSAASTTQVAP